MSGKYRVMVVDDDSDTRQLLRAMLSLKYEVVTAQDGVEALEKMETCEPDFFMLDVMMPVMDGFDTCEAIRRHPRFGSAMVFFVSGIESKEEMRRTYEVGGNFFIQKPFTPDRIMRNIAMSMQNAPLPAPKKMTLEQIEATEKAGTLQEAVEPAMPQAVAAPSRPAGAVPPRPMAPTTPPSTAARPQPAPRVPPAPAAPAGAPSPAAPRPQPAAAAMPRPAPSAAAPGQPVTNETLLKAHRVQPRLMIVDDDEDIQFVLTTAFGQKFEIITASDGRDAVSRIMEVEPDLLLLDISMPRMNGYQLCESLRRTRRFADLPIVFLSANTSPRDIKQAKQVGGNDFIGKPCSVGEVEKVLNRVLTSASFRIHPKRRKIEELISPERLYDEKKRSRSAKESVERDFGGLRKFIEENFMKDLK